MRGYYKKIRHCRMCNSGDLREVLKLKEQYIGSDFVKSNKNNEMSNVKIPLTLMLCEECGLVQLKETINPDLMYKNYFYRSNTTDTMKKDLRDVVEKTLEKVNIVDGDVVIDIGCNDATMLKMFPENMDRIGVDPATNIIREGVENIEIINAYFSKKALEPTLGNDKAKIITSCACFYDMPNPNKITREIRNLLHDDGVCTIQVSYLLDTIRDMNFYDITGEHLEYYSLEVLDRLMEDNDLSIFDCSLNGVNGGSLRIYVAPKTSNRMKTDEYWRILHEETAYQLKNISTYEDFSCKIREISDKIVNYISEVRSRGGLVLGLGASTKGNVLLQECGITKEIMPFISERNAIKVGLKTLGTDIEMISEQEARNMKPNVMFVLPWCFEKEIVARERDFINNGGTLLFAMPFARYIDKFGEHII